jgi:Terminase small subunit
MMRPLSYRQRLFVEYYLGESAGSAADAARRAGYRWPEKLGQRLVKQGEVRAAIDARVATVAMTADEVLARVAEVASSDLLDFIEVDPNGGCKVDMKLAKRLGLGRLIKRLRINKDGTQDIVLEARLPALVKLGEHYKLWKGEAQEEVTLVELAKGLREQYEQLPSEERDDPPAKALSEPSGGVQ